MRVPRWLSFALAGAALGWLAAAFFSSPVIGVIDWRSPLAVLFAPLTFGLVGLWIDRSIRARRPERPRRLAGAVVGAGVVAGGLTGSVEAVWRAVPLLDASGQVDDVVSSTALGAGLGAAAALVLFPGFYLLSRASLHLGVARAGSVAARTEVRRTWYVLTGFVAITLLAATPDWLAYGLGRAPKPWQSDLIAIVLAALVVGLAVAEVVALGRIAASARARAVMEPLRDHPYAMVQDCAAFLDLGVGQDLSGTLRRGTPYRAMERVGMVIYGDAELAREVCWGALRRAGWCLLLIGAIVGLHRVVAFPSVSLWYADRLCSAGDPYSCYHGWQMIQTDRATGELGQGDRLLRRACALGVADPDCNRSRER